MEQRAGGVSLWPSWAGCGGQVELGREQKEMVVLWRQGTACQDLPCLLEGWAGGLSPRPTRDNP